MTKLPNWLAELADNFSDLDTNDKLRYIKGTYEDLSMSWKEAAALAGTYPNKLRRIAVRAGYQSRSKSEAQSLALDSGRHPHPTKNKGHSQSTKEKISEGVATVWENLSESELEYRRQIGRDVWDSMSEQEQIEFRHKAGEAVRKAAKEGSKLEKFLYAELTKLNYSVELHKKHLIKDHRLHLDLYIPKLRTVIEIDGPSHFLDIWGKDILRRNQQADKKKNGLILSLGLCMIRIRQKQALSDKYKRDVLKKLVAKLEEFKIYPTRDKRYVVF